MNKKQAAMAALRATLDARSGGIYDIRRATLAARERFANDMISVEAKNGQCRVVELEYRGGAAAVKAVIIDWLPAAETADAITSL